VTPILNMRDVSCRRGGRLLFENLSLELGPGDAVIVTGPNGSGKSSLLRLIAGLLRSDSGAIETAATALADDNLALDRELPLGRALPFWGGAVDAATEALGLTPLMGVPVRLLSAGQRKRATIARVAASGAKLWLLDEPLNGLDTGAAALVAKLVDAHRAAGGAVVAASHSALEGAWTPLEFGQ
jgi:heme exporter protein A